MKKLIVIITFVFASCIGLYAEDVIQIRPANIKAGLTDDDEICLEVRMVNESFSVANLQFDLLLPEGVAYSYYAEGEAIPYTKKGKNYIYDFDVQDNVLASGYTRFLFVPKNELRPIENSDEVLLYLYITTSSTLKDGVYPILIDNIELDKTVTVSIKDIGMTASYLTVGDYSLETATNVDLSGMTGYIPSFVVEQLNTDIASNTNLRSLNLSGTTFANLGAELSVPNNDNLLWYTSDKASLNRTFKGEQWNTVCLPFTLQTSYLNASTVVKEMADYDGEATITLGDVTTMETGKPYLIYSSTDGQLIKDVTISNPVAVSNEPSTTSSNSLTMRGTYQEATVKSDGGYTRYGFTNGKFVMLGTGSATVPPFRAYLEYLGKSSTRSIGFAGDGTTSINSTVSEDESDGPLYDLKGVMVNENQQTKGIYVRNGKKLILK